MERCLFLFHILLTAFSEIRCKIVLFCRGTSLGNCWELFLDPVSLAFGAHEGSQVGTITFQKKIPTYSHLLGTVCKRGVLKNACVCVVIVIPQLVCCFYRILTLVLCGLGRCVRRYDQEGGEWRTGGTIRMKEQMEEEEKRREETGVCVSSVSPTIHIPKFTDNTKNNNII